MLLFTSSTTLTGSPRIAYCLLQERRLRAAPTTCYFSLPQLHLLVRHALPTACCRSVACALLLRHATFHFLNYTYWFATHCLLLAAGASPARCSYDMLLFTSSTTLTGSPRIAYCLLQERRLRAAPTTCYFSLPQLHLLVRH